uniref:Protein TsetseEP domain-containing protein n=1 Tax=Anopheles quadriannulatus TaxID=34691 RepID=A0A182XLY4_ANOQN
MRVFAVLAAIALVLAGTVASSSVEELQLQLDALGREIEAEVQRKRAENGDAILATNSYVLRIMGNDTANLRDIVNNKRTELEVEQWLREPEAAACFDEAFQLWDTYAYLTGWDVSWCAVVAYEETNADAQYKFHSHAQTIVREAARAMTLATEAYALHPTLDEQVEYLQQELYYLAVLWGNYQAVLQDEIDGHEEVAEQIVTSTRTCFEGVYDDVDYWFNYLDNALDQCLAALE